MWKSLLNLSNAIEEIEDGLYEVTDAILKASGGSNEGMGITRNVFGAKKQRWDVLMFLVGRPSHMGDQMNSLFMILNFLKKDIVFTVKHNFLHGQKGFPDFPSDHN